MKKLLLIFLMTFSFSSLIHAGTIRPETIPQALETEKKQNIIFTGTIFDREDHKAIKDVWIVLRNLVTREEFIVHSDRDGRYETPEIPADEYLLCYRKKGYYSPSYHLVPRAGVQIQLLDVPLVERKDQRLTGVVYAEDGWPIADANVKLKDPEKETLSDRYGTYVIDGIPADLESVHVSGEDYLDNYYSLHQSTYNNYNMRTLNIGLLKVMDAISVGPEGAVIHKKGGTTITIPKDALEEEVEIRITTIPTQFYEIAPNGIPTPNPAIHIDFKPSGLEFKKPVKIVTLALAPPRVSPPSDTTGTIPFLNGKTGKVEEIKAVYHNKTHTIRYAIDHFSRVIRNPYDQCRFVGKKRRVEKNDDKILYRQCIPEGCDDCLDYEYMIDWSIRNYTSSYLDFKLVRINGKIEKSPGSCRTCIQSDNVGSDYLYRTVKIKQTCSVDRCHETQFLAQVKGVFEIKAYQCSPWFIKKFYTYKSDLVTDQSKLVCRKGNSCGNGQVCNSSPSDCCYTVCDDGACNQYKPNMNSQDQCQRCNESNGLCGPYPGIGRPCSDGDPCTVKDQCHGIICRGQRVISREFPDECK